MMGTQEEERGTGEHTQLSGVMAESAPPLGLSRIAG